jgi:hypothetical protein
MTDDPGTGCVPPSAHAPPFPYVSPGPAPRLTGASPSTMTRQSHRVGSPTDRPVASRRPLLHVHREALAEPPLVNPSTSTHPTQDPLPRAPSTPLSSAADPSPITPRVVVRHARCMRARVRPTAHLDSHPKAVVPIYHSRHQSVCEPLSGDSTSGDGSVPLWSVSGRREDAPVVHESGRIVPIVDGPDDPEPLPESSSVSGVDPSESSGE